MMNCMWWYLGGGIKAKNFSYYFKMLFSCSTNLCVIFFYQISLRLIKSNHLENIVTLYVLQNNKIYMHPKLQNYVVLCHFCMMFLQT